MSFPKYYLTYCVMDTDAGANPFGHSCLLFSKQNCEQSPIRVIDSYGYYSQPSTTTNPVVVNIKKILGFKVDLQDGHGVLEQEPMRTINGDGLSGISFLVTELQFNNVLHDAKESIRIEKETINELNLELTHLGLEPNGYNRHILE
ncbi:MAG: hypothetical protein PSV35_04305, partial [bacterium]|nr:hypothetical protein [bacterium]